MKKFFISMLLVMMPICFIACGGDDEEKLNFSASIEGIWYLRYEKWYDWKDGKADMSKDPYVKQHTDNSFVWTIAIINGSPIITETRSGTIEETWANIESNKYRNQNGTGRDLVVVKSVTSESMEVELYDGYYGEGYETGKTSEYGVLTFMR